MSRAAIQACGLGALALVSLAACAASGKASFGTKSGADAEGNAETFSENAAATPPPEADAGAPTEPIKVAATGEPAPPKGPICPVKCTIANLGPVSAEENARLGPLLADSFQTLDRCAHRRKSTLTLRFDSQAQLTEFGVDDDESDVSCTDVVRVSRPPVTFAGPSTLRCAESCGRPTEKRSRARSRSR